MKNSQSIVRALATTCITTVFAGCATQSVPTERLGQVAVVTSGGTNLWTLPLFTPGVSVVEVDGIAPQNSFGPIELAPGNHKLKMKCGSNITENQITVAAGEVYEFALSYGSKGCEGSLYRAKSANQ